MHKKPLAETKFIYLKLAKFCSIVKMLVSAKLHNTSRSLKLESTNISAIKEIHATKEIKENSKKVQFLHTPHCLPFSQVV